MGLFAVSASCCMVEIKPWSSQSVASTSSNRIKVLTSLGELTVLLSIGTSSLGDETATPESCLFGKCCNSTTSSSEDCVSALTAL